MKVKIESQRAKVKQEKIFQACLLIQRCMRRSSLFKQKIERKKEAAAYKITTFIREILERKKNQVKEMIDVDRNGCSQTNIDEEISGIQIEVKESQCLPVNRSQDFIKRDDLVSEEVNNIGELEIVPSKLMSVNGTKNEVRHDEISIPIQAKMPFSQPCDTTRQLSSGRRIRFMRCFSNHDTMMDTSRIVANERPFLKSDPYKVGVIRRREFSLILKELWAGSGNPLSVAEEEAILKAFDCKDGYVDYKKYLRFASQQSQPCLLHGRFVCTDIKCTLIMNEEGTICPRTLDSLSNASICSCGRYIHSHTLLPRERDYEKRKRGLQVFSENDLIASFVKPKIPDLGTDGIIKLMQPDMIHSYSKYTDKRPSKPCISAKSSFEGITKINQNNLIDNSSESTKKYYTRGNKVNNYQLLLHDLLIFI